MLKRIKNFIKTKVAAAKAKIRACVHSAKVSYRVYKALMSARLQTVVAGTAAEAYVDTGVKILIAVVIGALLLGLLYALFNETVMPSVTEKVQGLFNYAG